MRLNQRQVQHLYWRAGFFAPYPVITARINRTPKELFDELLQASKKHKPIAVIDDNPMNYGKVNDMTPDQKREMRQTSTTAIKQLNYEWLEQMSNSQSALRERMSLFWHDHFACSSNNGFFMQSYLETIRKHSLGSFRDMLHGISKEPAMLQYLNNQQNRKDSPNENFAREVMELFTLGRDNGYTEHDIKEAARAFTGWGFGKEGGFVLKQKQHDYGEKTIFGQTGKFEGEDVLEMLLKNKQTAKYICSKLYKYLVNDQKVDQDKVDRLASVMYQNNYKIEPVLQEIFTSDWFYADENIGGKIKSPVDLIVGLRKSLSISFVEADGQIFIQRQLGQVLFYPPNVAGWPAGQTWIDSSTLLLRARLTEIILRSTELDLQVKDSGDDNDQLKIYGKLKKLGSQVNEPLLNQNLNGIKNKADQMANYLLQIPADQSTWVSQSNDALIDAIIAISKTPEFQLC